MRALGAHIENMEVEMQTLSTAIANVQNVLGTITSTLGHPSGTGKKKNSGATGLYNVASETLQQVRTLSSTGDCSHEEDFKKLEAHINAAVATLRRQFDEVCCLLQWFKHNCF
jgi:hypothetical protein